MVSREGGFDVASDRKDTVVQVVEFEEVRLLIHETEGTFAIQAHGLDGVALQRVVEALRGW